MSLNFSLSTTAPASAEIDCIIVGVFADAALTPAARALDTASGGRIAALVERGDLKGKPGTTTWLYDLPGISAPYVLLVGLGKVENFGIAAYGKAVSLAINTLKTSAVRSALLTLSELEIQGHANAWVIRQAVIAADHASYRYSATFSKKPEEISLENVVIYGNDNTALLQGQAIAAGVNYARELGNLPPNICTPAYLAQVACQFAVEHAGVQVQTLDEIQMQQESMGALLAVAQGSANRPRLIILKWSNGSAAKPYVLVGKGITFDTGGVNLKTQGGIEDMKYDMCGGAAVLGTFVAAVKARLPLNVVAIVPAVENAIDGNAYRPSDVITSMSGKTIEVGNTDAEGRLILCDALTYAQKYFEPEALVDVATLTGACMVALGHQANGLMSKHDDLATELVAAGEHSYDRAWRLPLWDEYQNLLDSSFADIYNIGGRWAGAITAGCFLSRFTEGQRWAHLDVAGSAFEEGKRGMATGRPVGLLSQWLIERVN